MGVYDRQVAQAQRLIAAKGMACTWLISQAPTAQDDSQPWILTDSDPQQVAVSIAFTSNVAILDKGDGIKGEATGLMAQTTFTPSLDDRVKLADGTILQPTKIEAVSPNGQVVIWELEFRQ